MAKKIYAVRKGRIPGIYQTWEECRQQVSGFSGAEYRGFPSRETAEAYLMMEREAGEWTDRPDTEAAAYVDGSYDPVSGQFSCGVVLLWRGGEEHFSQFYIDEELAAMRNVAGEIKGAEYAIRLCLERKIASVTIFHDYEGVAKWCTGAWKANKNGTIAYRDFYDAAREKIDIRFSKVQGHSGDYYNDLADRLAKEALGLL